MAQMSNAVGRKLMIEATTDWAESDSGRSNGVMVKNDLCVPSSTLCSP